jgi:hypothetical protein
MGEEILIDDVASAIKEAANGQIVTMIRLAVGKQVSVPQSIIASRLHQLFPQASIEMAKSAIADSVVVRDIEVE